MGELLDALDFAHETGAIHRDVKPAGTAWTNCFGETTYTFPNGERYVGGFSDGVYSGSGTYALPSGVKWTGEWRNGKRNGRGTEYRPGGTVLRTGIWENEKFSRPL